jgi:hypothetical protein
MTDATRVPGLACAGPTSRHPEGRTGTSAGYEAHRFAKEAPCAACSAAWTETQAVRRSGDYREHLQSVRTATLMRVGGTACRENPGRKYRGVPIGIRAGTPAGYMAHMKAGEEPCDPCRQAQAARTAIRRGTDPDGYGEYRQALSEYEERIRSGEAVLVCAKPSTEHPSGRTGTQAGYLAHYYEGEPACDSCLAGSAADQAQRRIDEPDLTLRGNLWANYRLSLERYMEILAEQGGKCAICPLDAPSDYRTSRFHVDHGHACCPGKKSCGKCVRGLLCHGCNTALGNFKDSPDNLLSAVAYLRRHGKEVAG